MGFVFNNELAEPIEYEVERDRAEKIGTYCRGERNRERKLAVPREIPREEKEKFNRKRHRNADFGE